MDRPQRTRREIIEMVLVSIGFALGISVIVWGVSGAVTGEEALGVPDTIDKVVPSPNDNQVLDQTEVFVDLADRTTAELIVDGITLDTTVLGTVKAEPGQQIDLPPTAVYDGGNYSIRFQPQDGAPIERWARGVHTVTVVYWDEEVGRSAAKSFTWTFTVL